MKCPVLVDGVRKHGTNPRLSWLEIYPHKQGTKAVRPWCRSCLQENRVGDSAVAIVNFYDPPPALELVVVAIDEALSRLGKTAAAGSITG